MSEAKINDLQVHVGRSEVGFENIAPELFKYRNFSGKNGDRYIQLELPEEYARELKNLGWRVKKRGLNEAIGGYMNSDNMDADLEDAHYFMSIKVNYESSVHVPDIWRIVDGYDAMVLLKPNHSNINRDVAILDKDKILTADLTISGSKPNAKDGLRTPYLWDAKFTVDRSYIDENNNKYSGFKRYADDGPLPWEQ